MNPNSNAQKAKEDPEYTGPILPGSRWRQEGMSGHAPQLFTVLRVGARSVMLVVEGGGANKGSKHRPGQQFNVVIEDFLRTHRLVSQPKGFQPEDLEIAATYDRTVKPLTVATMIEARRLPPRIGETITPTPITAPALGTGYVALPLPLSYPPYEPTEPTEPKEEPPVQPLLTPEVAASINAMLTTATPPAAPVEEEIVPDFSPGYSPEDEPVAEGEAEEVDPIEQFMESGRILVDKINVRISAAQEEIDRLKREADALQERRVQARTAYDRLVRQKGRIEGAVLAAISTAGDDEPEPVFPEPEPALVAPAPAPDTEPEIFVRPSVSGSTRLATKDGYIPQPGKVSQRQWVLDKLVAQGRLAIANCRDDFGREYGLDADRATKNVSSILAEHLRKPAGQWPLIVRVASGVYEVAK